MRSKLVHTADEHERTFVVAFAKDEDPVQLLGELARREDLGASRITAIGGFSSCVLGYFERSAKAYKRIVIDEQAEVLSLLGDIAHYRGRPVVHLHAVLGLADATTRGGHLLQARVWPTLEVVVTEWPIYLGKDFDPEVGLPLLSARHEALEYEVTLPVTPVDEVPTWIHDLHPAKPE